MTIIETTAFIVKLAIAIYSWGEIELQ